MVIHGIALGMTFRLSALYVITSFAETVDNMHVAFPRRGYTRTVANKAAGRKTLKSIQ